MHFRGLFPAENVVCDDILHSRPFLTGYAPLMSADGDDPFVH